MIALIDYGMGNLLSVSKALAAVGGEIEITSSAADIKRADAVILPGVGNFGDGMEHLRQYGLTGAVRDAVRCGKPYLGICLGMQMLLDESEEAPGIRGLGIYPGKVIRFADSAEKVPHMGWNTVHIRMQHPCLAGIPDNSYFYFVHSYYAVPADRNMVIATCDYIGEFAAVIGSGNVFATQFHPEKSQDKGIMILENFVRLCRENGRKDKASGQES